MKDIYRGNYITIVFLNNLVHYINIADIYNGTTKF